MRVDIQAILTHRYSWRSPRLRTEEIAVACQPFDYPALLRTSRPSAASVKPGSEKRVASSSGMALSLERRHARARGRQADPLQVGVQVERGPHVRYTLCLDAAQQAVAEVEVQRRRRNQQHAPPEAGVARIRGKGEQPDTDAKAHAGLGATVAVGV